jgi:predicted nucleic acid-binding protein
MMVVDASLGVKWFLDEPFSAEAVTLLVSGEEILAPALFHIEVAGVLVREANVDKSLAGQMRQALDGLEELITSATVRLITMEPESLSATADTAIRLGHPLKDCIYLALAMDLGCELLTCDARFAAKAKGVWAGVRVLGA